MAERNDFNAPNFTLRTRSFNGLCSNLFNMIGVWVMGTMLDFPFKSKHATRALRARVGIISLLVLTLSVWGGGYVHSHQAVDRGGGHRQGAACACGTVPFSLPSWIRWLALMNSPSFLTPHFLSAGTWLESPTPQNPCAHR